MHCFDDGDDRRGEASIATLGVRSFERQTFESTTTNQAQIFKTFKKKVKERTFKKDDLILAVRRPIVVTHKTKGKFQPKWKG